MFGISKWGASSLLIGLRADCFLNQKSVLFFQSYVEQSLGMSFPLLWPYRLYQNLRWQPLPLRCGTENGWEPNPWHWPPSVAEAQGDATDVMKSEPLELRSPQDGFALLHFSHVILYHMIAELSTHMNNDICLKILKAINQVALATCNFCNVITCNRSSSRRGMPSPPAALWVGRVKRGADGFLWFLGF